MTGQLPPYSGATTCPKCTCEFIDSTYCATAPGLHWTTDELNLVTNGIGYGPECMLRRCHDCGWAWLEHTADATPKA